MLLTHYPTTLHHPHHSRNEFDLEEARILRNKTKKRYEQFLAELEAAEVKRVVTLEGIARAKDLSVQVSECIVVCVVRGVYVLCCYA